MQAAFGTRLVPQESQQRKVHEKLLPWVEKYRPQTVDEVSHQEEVVRTLKKSLTTGNVPHLLFYGPPGTGKTSCILAIVKQLYGPTVWKQRVLELNASDERGIDVVREKVKKFAQVLVKGRPPEAEGYPCPPYKIIILDEADNMTSDAQAALRRVMENYTKVTRFCIICNYISRIIEPLASRCAKFRFSPVSDVAHLARLTHISSSEGLTVAKDAYDALLTISEGDLRRSITLLQSASTLFGSSVSKRNVQEVAGHIPDVVIRRIIEASKLSFDEMLSAMKDITAEGYQCSQLLQQLMVGIIKAPELGNRQKAMLLTLGFAQADQCLTEGADETLQLLNVASMIHRIMQQAKRAGPQ